MTMDTQRQIASWLRRGFATALMTWLVACGSDSAPRAAPEALRSADAPPAAAPSKAHTPPALRAAYIETVQRGASERYAAVDLGPGIVGAENEAQRFAATLDRSGLWVSSREAAWSLAMRAEALGCE